MITRFILSMRLVGLAKRRFLRGASNIIFVLDFLIAEMAAIGALYFFVVAPSAAHTIFAGYLALCYLIIPAISKTISMVFCYRFF